MPIATDPDSPPRLLIVEDDPAAHDALRRIFTRKGYEVVSARTVSEGLASLDRRPSCLILDLMLPDGDGMAILRKIRSESLPILVVIASGVSDPRWLVDVAELRPDALLTKPIDLTSLLRALGHPA